MLALEADVSARALVRFPEQYSSPRHAATLILPIQFHFHTRNSGAARLIAAPAMNRSGSFARHTNKERSP